MDLKSSIIAVFVYVHLLRHMQTISLVKTKNYKLHATVSEACSPVNITEKIVLKGTKAEGTKWRIGLRRWSHTPASWAWSPGWSKLWLLNCSTHRPVWKVATTWYRMLTVSSEPKKISYISSWNPRREMGLTKFDIWKNQVNCIDASHWWGPLPSRF